ncbi:Septum formation initiator [Caldalkalibacillus thermarum TA2.A1]|uniref:Septum formation initiator n=1 Tax=Caldalkalibacillus thermarum (strain TA2.A1) TaxID=986075 RepID=F5LA03_CALTT|nr:septum formation initiator family protein [Caldalkalibacillus thermarum]EGL81873.1 Septum formation initiator [Caldalkalibacillus thermarum TA2.A1]QZT34360.1 septum formation initiator family protein [Caldalkalibacillus thermarum TA2.A1]
MQTQQPWKQYGSYRDASNSQSSSEPLSNDREETRPAKARRRRMQAVGLLLVLFLTWAGLKWWDQQQMLQEMEAELNLLQVQVEEARKRQAELKTEINRLHDPEYIAEIARRDYFLSREGETIFKIKE